MEEDEMGPLILLLFNLEQVVFRVFVLWVSCWTDVWTLTQPFRGGLV